MPKLMRIIKDVVCRPHARLGCLIALCATILCGRSMAVVATWNDQSDGQVWPCPGKSPIVWPDNESWRQNLVMTECDGIPFPRVPANWTIGDTGIELPFYPDNGNGGLTYDVVIGSPAPTHLRFLGPTIDTLTIADEGRLLTFHHDITIAEGNVVNDGEIILGQGGGISPGVLIFAVDSQLSGSGRTILNNGFLAAIRDGNDTNASVISSANIEGWGGIGGSTADTNIAAFTNDGFIDANVSDRSITTDLRWGTFVNNSTMQASNGGILNLRRAVYVNSGDLFAADASTVNISDGARIVGGILHAAESGLIRVGSGKSPHMSGIIDNQTNVLVGNSSSFNAYETAELEGSGSIVLENGALYAAHEKTDTLINGPSHTIEGFGAIGGRVDSQTLGLFVNDGIVDANVADKQISINMRGGDAMNRGSIIVRPTANLRVSRADFDNVGHIVAENNSQITLGGGADVQNFGDILLSENSFLLADDARSPFETSGRVEIQVGAQFERFGDYVQTDGHTQIDGMLNTRRGDVVLRGGTISGSGTINGDLVSDAIIRPGNSPGKLTINGDFVGRSTSIISMELAGYEAGTQFDVLDVNGDATFAGTLQLSLLNGFLPRQGAVFDVVRVEGVSDQFQPQMDLSQLPLGFRFEVQRLPDALQISMASIPGDFNSDEDLNETDLQLLERASIENDMRFDLTGDKTVDADDILVWVQDLKNTWIGDANLDGQFDTADMILVFQANEYEDEILLNSSWSTGDWNGDREFDTSDLIAAFQDGGYEGGFRGDVRFVPEPTGVTLAFLFLVLLRMPKRAGVLH